MDTLAKIAIGIAALSVVGGYFLGGNSAPKAQAQSPMVQFLADNIKADPGEACSVWIIAGLAGRWQSNDPRIHALIKIFDANREARDALGDPTLSARERADYEKVIDTVDALIGSLEAKGLCRG
jgi:hypothetical protein